jgi:6-phospho-beta-glucosidase
MMTEAVRSIGKWQRSVGICDGPSSMLELIARLAQLPLDELSLEYFGLNHLGWIRSIEYKQQNIVPMLIQTLTQMGSIPGFHIDSHLVESLNLIPNEYLYYYYHSRQAVERILKAGQTRGELVSELNNQLFLKLKELKQKEDLEAMQAVHTEYIRQRGVTYMQAETSSLQNKQMEQLMQEGDDLGYARLALNLIEALEGCQPRQLIVNIPNQGAISGMSASDVVEIPAWISKDHIQPVAIGEIPDHCLGLMKLVKTYEKLTIEAAVENSRQKAVDAIALHPLVADYSLAQRLVEGYLQRHGVYFPKLT